MNATKRIARLIATASLFLASNAVGQPVAAHIAGVVRDQSGAILQQATVTVTNVSTGRAVTLESGVLGDYRAVALMPGDYDIKAEYPGFVAQTRRVSLFVGSDTTLNFTLTVSGASEQTTVTATVTAIETARSQPVSVVTRSDVAALPVLSATSRPRTTATGSRADQHDGWPVCRHQVRRRCRPAQRLHHSGRRRCGGRCAVGQPDDQCQSGRRAGVQSVP